MDVHTDERLTTFVQSVLPDVHVSLAAPSVDRIEARGVSLYLWRMRPAPPQTSRRTDVLCLNLEYLVSTWAREPADAHGMLLELAYAAMRERSFDVVLEPIETDAWLAFGIAPTPAFRLGTPSYRVVHDQRAKPVLHPLELSATALTDLAGRVHTPAGVPIANAMVEVPAIDRRARTDAGGRFRLRSLPAAPTEVRVRVVAKGQETWTNIGPADDRADVDIELDPLEESHA